MGMVALKCPACGANIELDDSRDFGFCNYCGTKVMQDKIVVEHQGSVKVDNTDRIQNLYTIARQASQTGNHTDAARYYDQIRQESPNDYEAAFYCVYETAMACKIAQISSAAQSICNTLGLVINLIKNAGFDQAQQENALSDIAAKCIYAAKALSQGAYNHHFGIDVNIRGDFNGEYEDRMLTCCKIDYIMGDLLISTFGETPFTTKLAADCYKNGIEVQGLTLKVMTSSVGKLVLDNMKEWEAKVKKYEPTYAIPEDAKKSGCYVATAVYGSYDCPQVWTLRRYRDNQLAKTWYGRAFIHTYYAISPTIVKLFGNTTWFKNMWRGKLDKMVNELNLNGVENTPYDDIQW